MFLPKKIGISWTIPLIGSFLVINSTPSVTAQGNAVDCYRYITEYGASPQRARDICSSYPAFAGTCAEKIRSLGGTWDQAESICKYGTAYSANCVEKVRDLGANWDHAQSICGNAIANTAVCVQQARNENFSWDNTVTECRRPDVAEALQNCMNGLMYDGNGKPTGVTPVAAENECRSGRR